MPARTPVLRVGGQALPDGVMMRAGDVWAVARSDGSVEMGRMPKARLVKVPLVRVLLALGPALSRGIRAMGRAGLRRDVPRRVRWALPLFLLAPLLVDFGIGRLLNVGPSWGWRSGVQMIALVGAQLAALRLALPGAMWRYHGAEHKAVAAYEAGVDLDDLDAVAACSRVHPRCGTNVVAVIVAAALLPLPTGGLVGVAVLAAVLAVAVETVTMAAKRPGSRLTRVLLAPGYLLQRFVTTAEPTREELAIGVRALRTCLGVLTAARVAEATERDLAAA